MVLILPSRIIFQHCRVVRRIDQTEYSVLQSQTEGDKANRGGRVTETLKMAEGETFVTRFPEMTDLTDDLCQDIPMAACQRRRADVEISMVGFQLKVGSLLTLRPNNLVVSCRKRVLSTRRQLYVYPRKSHYS